MQIPFVGQAYAHESLPISAQESINWYVEVNPETRAPISLQPTPGAKLFVAVGGGPIRGLHKMGDKIYAVTGEALYSITEVGVAVNLGAIEGTARVSMADNGTHLVIVNGTQGYSYTDGGSLAALDSDYQPSESVTYLDGYFVFVQKGTGKMFSSGLLDVSIDPLDFATAESAPDNALAVISDHRELFVFGETSTEVWYNAGGSSFPFSRSTILELGCAAAHSVAKIDNTVFWLADDGTIRRAEGYTPMAISTTALSREINGYTTLSDAFAYTYYYKGVPFYKITFPSEGKTWVYNAASGFWHREQTLNKGRHLSNCYVRAFNKHFVGDFENANIYELDSDTHTDNGAAIQRIRTTQHLQADNKRVFMSNLQILFEHGKGLTTGQGSDPQAMLQWSDDGGRTFSQEHWRGMGKIGEYTRRSIWRRLGSFRDRVIRLTVADPVRAVVLDATADIEVGDG